MNQNILIMKKKKVKNTLFGIGKWSFVGIVLFFLYLPILIIVIQSFNLSESRHVFSGFTLKWYVLMFQNRDLMEAITNTITIALLATVISVGLGTLFAIGIHSLDKKRRKRMILLNNVPVLNADIVTGVFLMLTFQGVAYLLPGVRVFGYVTMLISHIFFCLPYVILSILPKLNEIDHNLYDAALDLGCRPFQALQKVIIPSIQTGIITGALIAFTMSIDDFVISYMTTGHGVENFSIWLHTIKNPLQNNAMQMASAYNTLISVVTLLAILVYNILKKKKEKSK